MHRLTDEQLATIISWAKANAQFEKASLVASLRPLGIASGLVTGSARAGGCTLR